jgi:C1A family cysteine protease
MSWDEWKSHFGMAFNGEEDTARQAVFEANIAIIETENAKGNTYTLGVNQFTHLTLDEFKAQFTGANGGSVVGPAAAHLGELDLGERASSVDWSTDKSVVNPVKTQGDCGSCWAFSAVGTVESNYAIATGILGSYAEQQLVDCSKNGGSDGCKGGWNNHGIEYIGENGIASESDYKYKGAFSGGECKASKYTMALPAGAITGYKSVTANTDGLESALNSSPVAVTIHVTDSWKNYKSGVLTDDLDPLTCNPDHAVIAVGYDSNSFKIRNSFGPSWGEDGYVRISKSASNPICLWNSPLVVAQVASDVAV